MAQKFDYKKYWNERLDKELNLHSFGYLGWGKDYNQWLYKVRKHNFNKYVQTYIEDPSNRTVLDVGCGTGFYIDLWKRMGAKRVEGLDISTASVKHLTTKYPDYNFKVQDITSDALPPQKYDVISCMDVLFHIADDQLFLIALRI